MSTIGIIPFVIGIIISFLVGAVIAFFLGVEYRKKSAEAALGSAEEEAKRLISDAIKSAETKKKEAIIEAKDDIYKLKQDNEKEMKERRSEVSRLERRIQQKEESVDKKLDNLEKKEETLQNKLREADVKLQEAEDVKARQFEMLERISGFTADQAKNYLLANLEGELTHEKALRINQYESQLKDEADQRAKDDHRGSGRPLRRGLCCGNYGVGRSAAERRDEGPDHRARRPQYRTLETLTGVDLIIDDTPEAITLSSHDAVKREVARVSLERLIQDGRIHPARIEETG